MNMNKSMTLILAIVWLSGCASYKSNVMFSGAGSGNDNAWFEMSSFPIEVNDQIEINVLPWKGEELMIGNEEIMAQHIKITIDSKGYAQIPLLGKIFLQGYNLAEADSLLSLSFANFLTEPFVETRFLNKRVSVIGAEKTQVVELPSQTIRLSEVIALSGGIPSKSRANNIKILREDRYFIADLSRAKERLKNDIYIYPGDLIYIEPVKRPFSEGLRDSLPLISTLTSIITLFALVITIL